MNMTKLKKRICSLFHLIPSAYYYYSALYALLLYVILSAAKRFTFLPKKKKRPGENLRTTGQEEYEEFMSRYGNYAEGAPVIRR